MEFRRPSIWGMNDPSRHGSDRVAELLADPSVSYWLKDALRSALLRDSVDAARDALLLADVLGARCDQVLDQARLTSPNFPHG